MQVLQRALLRRIARLNRRHGLVEPGDHLMVACSGGKDSWALLHLLRAYEAMVPFSFRLTAVTLDQGQPGFDAAALQRHYTEHGFEHRIVYEDTFSVVKAQTPPEKTYCSLCSRMRRGILHRVADELGCNKIALGHHREDAVETLLLNMMFAGSIRPMAPKLPAPPGGHAVIRPVLWCREEDLGAHAANVGAPVSACNLCGTQPHAKRQVVKRMLAQLERSHAGIMDNLMASTRNVLLPEDMPASAQRASWEPVQAQACKGEGDLVVLGHDIHDRDRV